MLPPAATVVLGGVRRLPSALWGQPGVFLTYPSLRGPVSREPAVLHLS